MATTPDWLNLDAIVSADERRTIADLTSEGRQLEAMVRDWAQRVHSIRFAAPGHEIPGVPDEVQGIVDTLSGIDALYNLVCALTGHLEASVEEGKYSIGTIPDWAKNEERREGRVA